MRRALPFVLLAAGCSANVGEPVVPPPASGGDAGTNVATGHPDAAMPPPPEVYAPGPAAVRRLSSFEYARTVAMLAGEAAAAAAEPPPDTAVNGLDAIGSTELALSDRDVRAYEASARAIAEAGKAELVRRYGRCQTRDEAACLRGVAASLGRLAFRRALDADEVARWGAAALEASTAKQSFEEGVAFLAAGLLQSPSFLYRVEVGAPDPKDPTRRLLTQDELATRLAFFLTGRGPDAALLDRAAAGRLSTDDELRDAARALLETPEAKDALAAFYDEVLALRSLARVPKDRTLFPQWSESLALSMREETLRLIADVVWDRDADFRDILDAPYTFVNPELAALYGLPPLRGRAFEKVSLPEPTRRGGIFGHGSFLTMTSHAARTSPTLRGKLVRETLLCQQIPAPPPDVNTTIPPDPPNTPPRTMRERLAVHRDNQRCAGCHVLMDDIGLGLESFDAIGRFRTDENGAVIDPRSKLDGRDFSGARELGTVMRGLDATMICVARTLFRQATGHVELRSERPALEVVDRRFSTSGYRLKTLLVELAASEAFRTVEAQR